MTQSLGKHAIVEFFGCDKQRLNDPAFLEISLNNAADEAGATRVKSVFHKFSPHGVTGVVVVAESHLSIHTWPEYGYAAVDIFTCGDLIKNEKALHHLHKELKAKNYTVIELKRGIIDVPNLKHKGGEPHDT